MSPIKPDDPTFFTQQLFLIGTEDEDGSPRFAPISWISYTYGPPACLVMSIGGVKRTKANLEKRGQLTAAVVTPELLPFIEQCNSSTYKEKLANLKKPFFVKADEVSAPMVKDAVFTYECEVIDTKVFGECTTYFCKIRKIHASAEIMAMDFIDITRIRPVIYSPSNYFLPGEHLGEIGDFSRTEE